jgi:hypothetical protein
VAASIKAEVDGTPGTNDMPGRLVFSTTADGASSPSERMRIDSAGSVGIGETAQPYEKLLVSGIAPSSAANSRMVVVRGTIPSTTTSLVNSFRSSPNTQAASFTLDNLTHFAADQGTFGAGSAVTNQYGFTVATSLTGATNNYGFYSNIASGTGRWNFYAAGTAANYFGGLVDISGASAGQIKFPATQNASADANTLDDYEEGAFTPAATFGGNAVGMTFSVQLGGYTKIGRVVTYALHLVFSAKGSSTGTFSITGLPFTSSASFVSSCSVRMSGVTSGVGDTFIQGSMGAGVTAVQLSKIVAGAATNLTDADIAVTSAITLSGTYVI